MVAASHFQFLVVLVVAASSSVFGTFEWSTIKLQYSDIEISSTVK